MRAYLRDKDTGQLVIRTLTRDSNGRLVDHITCSRLTPTDDEIITLRGWPDVRCRAYHDNAGNEYLTPIPTTTCLDCGAEMEAFSPLDGGEYARCLACARNLPDPLRDEDILA